MLRCRLARSDDLTSWLELVREVEPLFGPMPDFATHAARAIDRGTALVVTEDDEAVLGAALLSRDDAPHRINWLAVRKQHRREGAGSLLMATILDRWPTGSITVVTFGQSILEGWPARRFYGQFGFTCLGATEPGPDGGDRDVYIRHAR
jgi:GNAT superfamily N-acetyltransferase